MTEAQRQTVAKRVEFVETLTEDGPLRPHELVEVLGHSRSTVTRALSELDEAGAVEKGDDGYRATPAGRIAAREYRRYQTRSAAVLSTKELLAAAQTGEELSADLLTGCETFESSSESPLRPLERVTDQLRRADTVRASLPSLGYPSLLRTLQRRAADAGVDSDLVFSPEGLDSLIRRDPRLVVRLAETESVSVSTADVPPFGLVITSTDDETTVSVVLYDSDGALEGVVRNKTRLAVDWADRQYEQVQAAASEATEELAVAKQSLSPDGGSSVHVEQSTQPATVDADDSDSPTAHALPEPLANEGFVALSRAYVQGRDETPPAVSWRTGFALEDVWNGHAVEREAPGDASGTMTELLLSSLREGTDQVLLGPPGAGKSTVCKSVACEWCSRDLGPLLYRSGGTAETLDATTLLEAYLRETDGQTLVVVEDAIREHANAVFEVQRSLADLDDVTFLFDARASEWEPTDGLALDSRPGASQRAGLETVRLPALDEQEYDRFVRRFETLLDIEVGVDGDTLQAELAKTAGGRDDAVGAPLLLGHSLAQRVDSRVDTETATPTKLEASARQFVQSLADDENQLRTDLAVLANVLNAADIPVAHEYLHTVGADRDDVEDAIASLDGTVLFGLQATGSPTYRTRHELWSVRFLEQFSDVVPLAQAQATFGRCVTNLLSLASNADLRARLKRELDGRTPRLNQVTADPETWADELVRRVFTLGVTNSSLQPLYGSTDDGFLDLPSDCSALVRHKQGYWRGMMAVKQGALDDAEREFEHTRSAVEADETLLATELAEGRLAAKRGLARVAMIQRETETARTTLSECLEHASELGHVHTQTAVRFELGGLAWSRDEQQDARTHMERTHTLASEHGLEQRAGEALVGLGTIDQAQGAFEAAKRRLEAGLERMDATSTSRERGNGLANLAGIEQRQGDLEAAERHYAEALELFRDTGRTLLVSRTLNGLASLERKRGELNEAETLAEEALSLVDERSPWHVSNALVTLGWIAHDRGVTEAAEARARDALDTAEGNDLPRAQANATRLLTRVHLDRGELDAAAAKLERYHELADRLESRAKRADATLLRARLEYQCGDHESAASNARQCLETYQERGDVHRVAFCLRFIGLVELDRGNVEAATATLQEGYETACESGAARTIDRLRTAVERLPTDEVELDRNLCTDDT